MSTQDAKRMITVAELLRREGVPPEQGTGKGMKAAVATGVAALCGATVTGMLALAPSLSTSFFPAESGGSPMAAGSGGFGASATDGSQARAGQVLKQAKQQAAEQAAPVVESSPRLASRAEQRVPRTPAMSQIAADPVRADAEAHSRRTESSPAAASGSSTESAESESTNSSTQSSSEQSSQSSRSKPEPEPTEQESTEPESTEKAPEETEPEQPPAEDAEQDPEDSTSPESAEQDEPKADSGQRGRPDQPGERGRRP